MDLKVGDLVKNAYAHPPERIARIIRLTFTEITLQDIPFGLVTDYYIYTMTIALSVDIGRVRRCTKLELLLLGLDHEL